MTLEPSTDPDLRALRRLSAALGRDPDRVQAAGGNTSLKRDGVMWIKASGTWLAAAEDEEILVPVRLEPLLQAMRDGDPGADGNPGGRRDASSDSGRRDHAAGHLRHSPVAGAG